MGGRGASSGGGGGRGGTTINGTAFEMEDFDGASAYARELAENMLDSAQYPDEDEALMVLRRDGVVGAAAFVGESSDGNELILQDIAATGRIPGAGTELFVDVMKRAQSEGKGLYWVAETASANSYYQKFGFYAYSRRSGGMTHYNVPNRKLGYYIDRMGR